jgi:hypothetical protein
MSHAPSPQNNHQPSNGPQDPRDRLHQALDKWADLGKITIESIPPRKRPVVAIFIFAAAVIAVCVVFNAPWYAYVLFTLIVFAILWCL